MSVFEQLQSVIATTLKVPAGRIGETTRDENIAAWDSLGHVHLMMALEQTFNVYVDVEDFARLNSVPAILEYLQKHGRT